MDIPPPPTPDYGPPSKEIGCALLVAYALIVLVGALALWLLGSSGR